MGFNFVALFNYYITIFYLYGGDTPAAVTLLGINGTVWAVTGLFAVFPLNWTSRRLGKNLTLIIAILLMCAAQLSKIVCYNPNLPYLVVIPTVLLSAGMLMFFTLGSSMVGDVCDEADPKTGARSEGSYYSVYRWFIKMGTAFASFVTGALLVVTHFDEKQTTRVDELSGSIAVIQARAEAWQEESTDLGARAVEFEQQIAKTITSAQQLQQHMLKRVEDHPDSAEHSKQLADRVADIRAVAEDLRVEGPQLVAEPAELTARTQSLIGQTVPLTLQTPKTLFLLRAIEIGLPLLLSIVSLTLAFRYPLTEERCYEIKQILQSRKEEEGDD